LQTFIYSITADFYPSFMLSFIHGVYPKNLRIMLSDVPYC